MTHDELFELHKKFFGDPVAHFPEDCETWEDKPCTVFFASCAHWTPFKLRHGIKGFSVIFQGPFTPSKVQVKIPGDGYFIFLEDD